MNTAAKVDELMQEWRNEGVANTVFVVRLANACIGWTYIYGARGDYCTSSYRQQVYNKYPSYTNLITKCQKLSKGKDTCSGCYWYPGGRTRGYDCRGFTYWLFKQIGIIINGAGATSQWNTDANWSEKGTIDKMPRDKVCCVFRKSGSKMEHTLLYDGEGHYIHDSGEVKKVDTGKYAATHYAIPKGLYDEPQPQPVPPVPTGKAVVTGKNVALREGPSTGTRVMVRIATGTTVDIDQVSGWTYVRYGTKYGFMMNDYIEIHDNNVKVTGKNVALRAGTSTSTQVLTRIPTGTEVPRAELPSDWTYVRYGTRKGFMMNQYIRKG